MISTGQKIFTIVALILLFLLMYSLSSVLIPFLIAAFLAYLGDPLVNKLIKLGLPRTLSATIVFTVIIVFLLSLLILLVPLLVKQTETLFQQLPILNNWMQTTLFPWLQMHLDITPQFNLASAKSALVTHWQQAGNLADKVFKTLSDSTRALLGFLINLILIPVVTFYLLRDFPKLTSYLRNAVPRKYLPPLTTLLKECNTVLGAFFRGQLLVMLILGVIYSVGLMIIGLKLALLIGVLIAIFSIVPYLGFITGLLLATIATLIQFHDTPHLIYVLVLFLGGHILEGMVLTPWLIGTHVGLHPVAVIFAILAGGVLFGFFGVLLAIPIAAVLMVLLKFLYQKYLHSPFYIT